MQTPAYIKLSELVQQVEEVIKQAFGSSQYWIVAEISGHKFYPNNDRHYFEFIEKSEASEDPVARVRGVSWAAGSQHIKAFEEMTGQRFGNGIEVLARVKVDFHKQYGFQLTLVDIDASFTLGKLAMQRQETLLKLITEYPAIVQKSGDKYISRNSRLPLPSVIQQIAIIGSPNSEGYADFMHTLSSNRFGYTFTTEVYQSSVQGAEAENELINKMIAIHQSGKKYDCVVIIRGGGSKSDFLVFDKFKLALAVAKFPVPVITGIGHHNDVSIVDLMAHTETKTPTKAAEFIVSHNRNFEEKIIFLQRSVIIRSQQLLGHLQREVQTTHRQLLQAVTAHLHTERNTLSEIQQLITGQAKTTLYVKNTALLSLFSQIASTPRIVTAGRRQELETVASGIKVFTQKYLTNKKGYLGHYDSVIRLLSPDNILKRGFAIISHKGKIIKDANDIEKGDEISITLEKNILTANVIKKEENGN